MAARERGASSKRRDARGEGPGGAINSNDKDKKVTRSRVMGPYAKEKSDGEE